MARQPTTAQTAEQKIDAVIVRAHTPRVVINLQDAAVDEKEVTPELLGRYHSAGWRTAELKNGVLILSN